MLTVALLMEERPRLKKMSGRSALTPYFRQDRKVARDSFVSCKGSRYGARC